MICFISGGARCGKSRFAEGYIRENTTQRRIYIATSVPYDQEMMLRVKKHQQDRANDQWVTIEKSIDIVEILGELKTTDVVLLDCLTILLSNEMFNNGVKLEVVEKIYQDIIALSQGVKLLVIVSNDIFSGSSTIDEYTKKYLENLGSLHIHIVEIADEAYECICGLPVIRKFEENRASNK